MIAQGIRDYFSRLFLGKVTVNNLPCIMASPKTSSLKRVIETHPIRTRMNVVGSTFFSLSGLSCSGKGFRFSSQLVKVKGAKIAKYVPEETKARSVPLLGLKVCNDRKRMEIFPQERTNRLQWQIVRPKKDGEMVLAWFGPIVDEAIVKLTLNKQQGTLLIWYNPQSRHFNSRGLYLYRRLGADKNLEWRWV